MLNLAKTNIIGLQQEGKLIPQSDVRRLPQQTESYVTFLREHRVIIFCACEAKSLSFLFTFRFVISFRRHPPSMSSSQNDEVFDSPSICKNKQYIYFLKTTESANA